MALKTNFEATNVVSSPFVDEIANPGRGMAGQLQHNADLIQGMHDDRLGVTPTPTAQISKADRAAKLKGTADERAQNQVNLDEARHGNRADNKNRDKAEGL